MTTNLISSNYSDPIYYSLIYIIIQLACISMEITVSITVIILVSFILPKSIAFTMYCSKKGHIMIRLHYPLGEVRYQL